MNLKQLTFKEECLRGYVPSLVDWIGNLEEWLKFKFIYNSYAIDGGALSRISTVTFMDKGITARGKTIEDHLEIINHVQALEWVKQSSERDLSLLKEEDIQHLHSLLMEGIDDKNAGKYRKVGKKVDGSCVVIPKPEGIPKLVSDFVAWIGKDQISHPAYLAAQVHLKFLKIRPFVSGNGPLARLLMNLVLLSLGYPMSFISVEDRNRYFISLEKAYLGDQEDYLNLMYEAVDRSLEKYLYFARNSLRA